MYGPKRPSLTDDELAVVGILAEHAVARHGRVDELLRLLGRQFVGCELLGDVDPSRRGLEIGGVDHVEIRDRTSRTAAWSCR
jgi:hypothetical protein